MSEPEQVLALSAAQTGLWFAQRLDPHNPVFSVAAYLEVHGPIDPELFVRAIHRVVADTDMLRVRFTEKDGVPGQVVQADAEHVVPVLDFRGEPEPFTAARAWMRRDLDTPPAADLTGLITIALLRVDDDHYLCYQRVHHLLVDGYGAALLMLRIAVVYSALIAGTPVPEHTFGSLAEVLDAESTYRESEQYARDRSFWTQRLAGLTEIPALTEGTAPPADHVLRCTYELAADRADAVRALATASGARWTSVVLAVIAAYTHRRTGASDLVLGLPVTARRSTPARATPSVLSNVIPLRVRVRPEDSVTDVIRTVGERAREALRHQRYRLEDLRRDRGMLAHSARLVGPSVNIMAFGQDLNFAGHPATWQPLSVGPIDDLTFLVQGGAAGEPIRVDLDANPSLYDRAELHAHRDGLHRLVDAALDDATRPVGGLPLYSAAQTGRYLALGSRRARQREAAQTPHSTASMPPTADEPPMPLAEAGQAVLTTPPAATTLHTLLLEQAARTPDAIAVVDERNSLTFRELDVASGRMAARLTELGVTRGSRVGVALDRGVDFVITLFAVLRSGGVHLPIDVSSPPARIAMLVADAAPSWVIAGAAQAERLLPPETPVLLSIDRELRILRGPKADDVEHVEPSDGQHGRGPAGPADSAYIVFTSGSTGRPKGVEVEHASLVNLLRHQQSELFEPSLRRVGRARLRVALTAAMSFDAAWDPILWLVAGHELHIAAESVRRDPEMLLAFLRESAIDVIETTPSFARHLLAAGLGQDATPSVVALGGEAVDEVLWSRMRELTHVHAVNLYGPTETTVNAIVARLSDRERPMIGTPISGVAAYVLDAGLTPTAPGRVGELYLAGAGLAKGYVGRPSATAERFLADPFGPPGGRMYRTGDLVRWTDEAVLEFVGRSDDQVALRGHRLEPGEITAVLDGHPAVASSAVVVRDSGGDDAKLIAYLVAACAPPPERAELRAYLSARLPAVFVPADFVLLDELPLTPNGKLDVRALPAVAIGAGDDRLSSTTREPSGEREKILCGLFAEVLGTATVGMDTDFFVEGGHSLTAARLVGRIRSVFGVEVPIRALFDAPTPEGLLPALDVTAVARPRLHAVAADGPVPLSAGQRRLWFLNRLDPDDPSYHIPVLLRLTGEVDHGALRRALADVVERHEILRTVYPDGEDTEPTPIVLPTEHVDLDLAEWEVTPARLSEQTAELVHAGMDLRDTPPLRTALLRLSASEHVLVLVLHHIAGDAWSMRILAEDLSAAYRARLDDMPPSWSVLPSNYADYSRWQRELLGDDGDPTSLARVQQDFWAAQLAGLPEEATLPTDRPRRDRRSRRGGTIPVELDAALHRAIVRLARECNVSVFMVVQAVFASVLSRSGAGHDIALGTPVAGRSDEALSNVIGFFVNTLVLRTDTSGDPTMRELLARVRERDLAVYSHQDLPFERLVEFLAPPRSQARHPLFQVMLSFQNDTAPALRLPGLTVAVEPLPSGGPAKFDLLLDLAERTDPAGRPAGLLGTLDYDAELFDEATATRLLERLDRFLRAAVETPDVPIGAIDVLAPEERRALLVEWNDTAVPVEPETVVEAFQRQAGRTPDAVAVVASAPRTGELRGATSLTFGELNDQADRLARRLTAFGARPDRLVALALPRDVSWAVALIAVLKSGAAVLPLDLSAPAERLGHLLEQARPCCLITADDAGVAVASALPTVLIDDPAPEVGPGDDEQHRFETPIARPADAAYAIFTSGSTGRPKGVVVEHRSLSNLLARHRTELFHPAVEAAGGRRLRVALTAAVSFDAAWDPILWLIDGHELHLVDEVTRRDAESLSAYLRDQRIDVVETTPSYLDGLRRHGLLDGPGHRPGVLALGGEAVSGPQWMELAQLTDVRVVNLYGPTECTVDSVIAEVTERDRPTIGRPVANTRAYVLDTGLHPTPIGVGGELYLAGAGVARGYLGGAAATAERFVADPFAGVGGRMYRTGDLARWAEDGQLEFLGRADDQVKVRGHRVELGEIAAVLREHPDVRSAAVLLREDRPGNPRLVAYLVPAEDEMRSGSAAGAAALEATDDTVSATALDAGVRELAARLLPDYMRPSAYVHLAQLPLTTHGKLDVRALPAPPVGNRTGSAVAEAPDRPATHAEKQLAELFGEVLDVDLVGIDDDFFALGGHSLLVTTLMGRVRGVLGVELPMRTLFESPTPALLATRLPEAVAARPALSRMDRPARVPLSFAQQRLWFLNQLEGPSPAYNIVLPVVLTGDLDREAMAAALGDLTDRHEPLRTVFPEVGGVAHQVVLDRELARPVPTVTPVAAGNWMEHAKTVASAGFDLTVEVPLRAHLLVLGHRQHVLVLVLHHIAGDGWSTAPLARDLSTAYAARRIGRSPEFTPLPVQYADYTLWQRDLLGLEEDRYSIISRQRDFWAKTLADLPDELPLPTDRPRPPESSYRGGSVELGLDAELHASVLTLARERGVSVFMVLQAALAALLTRSGAGGDVPIGTAVAGRVDEALSEVVGFFVNTVVLRTDTSGDPAFVELLDRVRDRALAAYSHQDLPFERLVELLAPPRSLSRHPLFQVMLTVNNTPSAALRLPGLNVVIDPLDTGAAKFDLSLTLTERWTDDRRPAGLRGSLDYAADLFDHDTAARLADHWQRLLAAAVTRPDLPIGELDMLSPGERTRLLVDWNDTAWSTPPHTVVAEFERTAAEHPETIAVASSTEPGSVTAVAPFAPPGQFLPARPWTAAELNGRANRLARLLIEKGVCRETRVAVALPRSVETLVALLAVLKAGGCYVPVDIGQPTERIAAVLADAAPFGVITARTVSLPWERLTTTEIAPIIMDRPDIVRALATRSAADLGPIDRMREPRLDDVAYVIHTSGSTGRPKGVAVEHGSLANLLAHHRERLFAPSVRRLGRDRLRVAHTAALSFDASWDPLLWMIDGHELHLVDDAARRDPATLVALVQAQRIDVLETTPSLLRALLTEGLLTSDLHRPQVIALGGEAVDESLWSTLRGHPDVLAVNLYGPTECTVDSVIAEIGDQRRPAIGRPVANTRAYVLDSCLRPVAPGVAGELYLAGAGLARGYLGRTAPTAERFVADLFGPTGERMYRTGDLVRWSGTGDLEFVGRADDQISLRGLRIEPGEVTSALTRHPEVLAAAVVVREDRPGDQRLVAYLRASDNELSAAELRTHLIALLPDYMIPSAYVVVDALPLTGHGKLDVRALPVPPAPLAEPSRVAEGPTESLLCTLFAEVLGIDRVGVDDDFFLLGGHSLSATRLVSRIRAALGVDLPIRALFEAPTPGGLAALAASGESGDPLAVLLPLRAAGSQPPLFCVHPAGGIGWAYSGLLMHLDPDQPAYALQARNLTEPGPLPDSIEAIAADYVAELRMVAPHGPYRLLGWSFGGNLVQEMAALLEADGERVELLAILDAYPTIPAGDLESAPVDTVYRVLLKNLGYDLADLAGEADATPTALDAATVREIFRRNDHPFGSLTVQTLEQMVAIFANQGQLMRLAAPKVVSADVLFFTATLGRDADSPRTQSWEPFLSGRFDDHPVTATHAGMLGVEPLRQIGAVLAEKLADLSRNSTVLRMGAAE